GPKRDLDGDGKISDEKVTPTKKATGGAAEGDGSETPKSKSKNKGGRPRSTRAGEKSENGRGWAKTSLDDGLSLHEKPEGGESADTLTELHNREGRVIGTAKVGPTGATGEVHGQKVTAKNKAGWVLAARKADRDFQATRPKRDSAATQKRPLETSDRAADKHLNDNGVDGTKARIAQLRALAD